MMSTFLVDELRKKVEKTPGEVLAYFFCDDKDKGRSEPAVILRSLIWQLLLQRNERFRHIQPDSKEQGNGIFRDFFALWRVFKAMLADKQAGEVFVLVDALDECESSQRKGFLQGIKELVRSPPMTGKFKFLVTCRPEIRDIEDELEGVGNLSEYIDFKVNHLASRRGWEGVKDMVKKALKHESGGTFLWVSRTQQSVSAPSGR